MHRARFRIPCAPCYSQSLLHSIYCYTTDLRLFVKFNYTSLKSPSITSSSALDPALLHRPVHSCQGLLHPVHPAVPEQPAHTSW